MGSVNVTFDVLFTKGTQTEPDQTIELLQEKVESLETFIRTKYDDLVRRVFVTETVLLEEFGIKSLNYGQHVVGLLDKNMMRLRSSQKKAFRIKTASISTTRNRLPRGVNALSSTAVKVEPDNSSSLDSEDHDFDLDTVASVNVEITDDEERNSETEEPIQDSQRQNKYVTITRSGRKSIRNSKFTIGPSVHEEDSAEYVPEDTPKKRKDSGSKIHKCDICSKNFANRGNLVAHRRMCQLASSQQDWKFRCDLCNQVFRTEFKRDHHRKMHTESQLRPHKCDTPGCDGAFKFRTQLLVHQRVHQTNRQYSCTLCGKQYKHHSGVRIHMLTHKQLKMYSCPVVPCDKKFYTRTNAKRHVQQVHKNVDETLEIPKDDSLLPVERPKKPALPPTIKIIINDEKVNSEADESIQDSQRQNKHGTITRSGRKSIVNPKFKIEPSDPVEYEEEDTAEFVPDDPDQKRKDTVPRIHICDICGKEVVKRGNLVAHRRRCQLASSQKNWKFRCELCNQVFRTQFKRDHHRKMHTESQLRPHKCDKCEYAFKFKTQLMVHQRVHQSKRLYSCTLCGKQYKHNGGVRIHMLTHKQLKMFSCPLASCGKKFYTRAKAKRHVQQVHKYLDENVEIPKDDSLLPPAPPKTPAPPRKRPPRPVCKIVCDQCGACVLRNNFKHHLTTHEITVSCDQCGKGFATEFGLKSHMEHAHDLERPFLCKFPDCESRFHSVSNLKTHQLTHTEDRSYRCEPCNRSYKHKGGLKVHINSCHSKVKQFPCSVCARVFDTRTHLKRHVMKVHKFDKDEAEEMTKVDKPTKSDPPRLPCEHCLKTYRTKYDLRLHQNAAHTRDTKFPCLYCEKVFYRRNHQRRHLEKVHNQKMTVAEMYTENVEFPPSPQSPTVKRSLEEYPVEPGTVIEIVEYDGQEFRHVEEVTL